MGEGGRDVGVPALAGPSELSFRSARVGPWKEVEDRLKPGLQQEPAFQRELFETRGALERKGDGKRRPIVAVRDARVGFGRGRQFWSIHDCTTPGLCSRSFSIAKNFRGTSKFHRDDGLENLQIFTEKKCR